MAALVDPGGTVGKHDKPAPQNPPPNDPPDNSDGQSGDVSKSGSGGHRR